MAAIVAFLQNIRWTNTPFILVPFRELSILYLPLLDDNPLPGMHVYKAGHNLAVSNIEKESTQLLCAVAAEEKEKLVKCKLLRHSCLCEAL